MQVEILSPEKKVFSGEADSVQFPGITGSFQVLNNHAAMIAALTNGNIKVSHKKNGEQLFAITGGFVEVLNNTVSVLIEGTAE